MPIPRPRDMFATADDPVSIAEAFDAYKAALADAPARALGPGSGLGGDTSPAGALTKALADPTIAKAVSAETLASVQQQLATADVTKDITLTGPLASGLVAYDLERPAKMLAPRPTPLRNRIARRRGIGTAHQFKVITGFTGTGTGPGLIHPGITESSTAQFGQINYLRGPKITYAGHDVSVPYKQFSVSDQVSWAAQFAGQGFDDIRQLSQTSVLYASMLLEERMILGGRGIGGSFSGALAAPTGVAVSTPVASGDQVPVTGALANVYAKVTATTMWGETTLSSDATSAFTAGDVIDITWTAVPGATGYNVFVGTHATADSGDASRWLQATVSTNRAILEGAFKTSGTAASTVTANTTAYATGYDGILAYCLGPNSGHIEAVDGPLSATNPGTEFQDVFAALYDKVKADPDEILANGHDRRQLSDRLQSASSNNYRITLENAPAAPGGAHNAKIGSLVTGVQNEVTGKMVDLTVHPWLPQGVMPVISWTLPIPDSQVSDVWAVYNVQDYMSVEWPVTQFAYETSSYWFGTLVCYAPGWCGAVTGIEKA